MPEPAPPAHWRAADLRRPIGLLTALAAFTGSVLTSFNVSCQVHEIGHALVGTALGWTVDRIHPCLPAGGAVVYASTPGGPWVNIVESFAGGVIAAAFLGLVYWFVVFRPRAPLRGPAWWAAGFGPALLIGPQLVVGLVEGFNPHRDYTAVLDANVGLAVASFSGVMLAGATAHLWLWRSVWQR